MGKKCYIRKKSFRQPNKKIEFRDLSKISQRIYKFRRSRLEKRPNQLYIFIDNKHRNAQPEALASLLSHEAVHQDEYSSIEEETYAWGCEADVWIQQKKRKPEISAI
ncbi:MAG: hypothetical protein M0C28_31405 [Candidatus Moduliflexus flocculans]|nr:hypothetical protein [Candidatus Moduliflexus flocculans]